MNCAEYKELLVAYIEGILDESQKEIIAEHLKDCASCQAEVKELSDLRGRLIKNGKVLARSDLENVVLDRIIREQNVRLKTATKISTSLKIRRIIMKSKITRFAAAAAIIIVALVGVSQFFGGTVTFAEVIQPILNARTVVLDIIVGGEETGPVMHEIVVGSRIRRTFSNMETILILDLDNAKMLTLNPQGKVAAYIDIQGPLQEGTRNYLGLVRNIVTDLKDQPDLPVQELGQQEIDGRKAVGFHVSSGNTELTIWAEPDTALPIRIELLQGQSLMILKNIEFDVPVEDPLVSMDVPAGYTLHEKELDMRQFTEQDFIQVLRLWAEHLLNGAFPESMSLEDLMNQTPAIGEKIDQLKLSDEEKMQLGMTFGRGLVFIQQLITNGRDWHYAGKGVKLGDAEKAVFWYQPENSATYRVIYGDLSIKDVAPEDLPK